MKTDEWLMKGPITPAGEPGVHMSKKGKKYRIIPFEHGGKGGDTSETAKFKTHLTGRIHEELELENKRRKANGQSKIHFGGIERYKQNSLDQNGKLHKKGEIIEGKVHDLSIFGSKEKSHWSTGPLTRLAVYQKIHKDAQGNPITNKAGKVKASRSWLTFRTASQGVPDKNLSIRLLLRRISYKEPANGPKTNSIIKYYPIFSQNGEINKYGWRNVSHRCFY